ncbi:hypothetical protein [Priestia megaterium]|uniref:hypothetical protein n=1 Tax=Priestia megaterium TaxID=1404 RepID=UPI000BFC21FA|nr:hypothetical protein [Priestia megaterium]PGO60671.1 hypothetical protein CN981_08970 [Priestia megaterium]
MIIIRDILTSKEAKEADSIFINDNGDQIHYTEKEERTKNILLRLAGKALIPTSETVETKSDYLGDYIIYDTSIGIIVTLIKDKKGDQ